MAPVWRQQSSHRSKKFRKVQALSVQPPRYADLLWFAGARVPNPTVHLRNKDLDINSKCFEELPITFGGWCANGHGRRAWLGLSCLSFVLF